MAEHNDKGNWGEEVAAKHLIKKGYKILKRNFIFDKAEIDIIAEHKNTLVIVEVKTRSNDFYGSPTDAISNKKIKLIIHAAEAYLNQNEIDLETRFDVISVVGSTPVKIDHIEDAFYPEL